MLVCGERDFLLCLVNSDGSETLGEARLLGREEEPSRIRECYLELSIGAGDS